MSGYCVFCGSSDVAVRNVRFPKTFTAYQFLQAGSGSCLRCYNMFRDPKYRRNSWLIKDDNFMILENPIKTLLSPPDPPYFLYLTETRRKHGWILAVQNPVLNNERFFLIVDEEKIYCERRQLEKMVCFVNYLKSLGLPKKALLSHPEPSLLRKFKLERKHIEELRRLIGNRLWRVVVNFGYKNL